MGSHQTPQARPPPQIEEDRHIQEINSTRQLDLTYQGTERKPRTRSKTKCRFGPYKSKNAVLHRRHTTSGNECPPPIPTTEVESTERRDTSSLGPSSTNYQYNQEIEPAPLGPCRVTLTPPTPARTIRSRATSPLPPKPHAPLPIGSSSEGWASLKRN